MKSYFLRKRLTGLQNSYDALIILSSKSPEILLLEHLRLKIILKTHSKHLNYVIKYIIHNHTLTKFLIIYILRLSLSMGWL